MARKPLLEPLAEDLIPTISALGRNIVQTSVADDAKVTQHIHADITVPLEDPLARRETAGLALAVRRVRLESALGVRPLAQITRPAQPGEASPVAQARGPTNLRLFR